MKKIISLFGALLVGAFLIPTSSAQAATTALSALQPGDLIRTEVSPSVSYYGADGFRYIFPNEKTYFTWYKDFKMVKWISVSDMQKIQIRGNITYRPGARLLKITSDPTVYAVSRNGSLRALATEQIATDLYGADWQKSVDDVPDAFFGNYQRGLALTEASLYSKTAESDENPTIADERSLKPAVQISITPDGFVDPTTYIKFGTPIRFVNTDTKPHSATEWDSLWGSGTLQPGESFNIYLPKIGSWGFYSTYDLPKTKMTGFVIVE